MPASLSVAANLPPERRKDLAIPSLAGTEPLAKMAAREGISRKFLYRQKRKAEAALDQAFVPFEDDPAVLVYLPVTAAWLTQLVLGLIQIIGSDPEISPQIRPPGVSRRAGRRDHSQPIGQVVRWHRPGPPRPLCSAPP